MGEDRIGLRKAHYDLSRLSTENAEDDRLVDRIFRSSVDAPGEYSEGIFGSSQNMVTLNMAQNVRMIIYTS